MVRRASKTLAGALCGAAVAVIAAAFFTLFWFEPQPYLGLVTQGCFLTFLLVPFGVAAGILVARKWRAAGQAPHPSRPRRAARRFRHRNQDK